MDVPEALRPADILSRRALLLVDIRPADERVGELGFVPGSLSIPVTDVDEESLSRLRRELQPSETAVLVCATGRRSAKLLAAAREVFPRPITHLEGGVLEWSAEGLPTCGLRHPDLDALLQDIESTEDFRQALRSCFVAEMVERSLSEEAAEASDVMALLARCYDAEGVDPDEPPSLDALFRVIDRMAVESWRQGTAPETIALNTDRMRTALQRLERRSA